MCENAGPRRLLQGGVWRWGWPHPELPFLPAPAPLAAQSPTRTARASDASGLCPLAPLGVWPFSGLCFPPRARGETHSSLCHFPSWAAKGPGRSPRPFPLLTVFILISSLPPTKNPHPAAPLMLHRWEQGRRLGPSPFLPQVSLQPPPATGAFRKGASSEYLQS